MCESCLAGTERCPSCQRRFLDTENERTVVLSPQGATSTSVRPEVDTRGRTWGVVTAIALALFGLRALRALIPSNEPDPEQLQQQFEALRAFESQDATEVDALGRAADAQRARFQAAAIAPGCRGVVDPVEVHWSGEEDLRHVLRQHLGTEGHGAAILSVTELPFELPAPPAFPPERQLRLTVLEWEDPTPSMSGFVVATIEDRSPTADRTYCEARVHITGQAPASIDAARFDLLWTALRQGALQLRPTP
ncbi:MAG: hypothetical protein AB8I08_39070 [Sandaracinaceae bacterium]